MARLLIALLGYLASAFTTKFLVSLGLSLGLGLFILKVIDDYITKALQQLNTGIPYNVLAFANIAKVDVCLSIIIGGIVFVATYKSLKVSIISTGN